jgi:hypothetical protein
MIARERHQGLWLGQIAANIASDLRRAGVSGEAEQLIDAGIGGQRYGEGMFSGAASKDEDLHDKLLRKLQLLSWIQRDAMPETAAVAPRLRLSVGGRFSVLG